MINFKKIRLKGFKSFVEPTEIVIEQGLTGIVGPNGCGKSNLVEAFRFVMGELSPKQMRGDELDDVIFNGTAERPAWDIAEVTLELDNTLRKAPNLFNDSDKIDVTRRIWRGEGSEYKVNGKDVRLKDVQLLFADAATGARSTSIVSQGRIGAIIVAKPEQRRALLEEAAGITGLHSRRHDAELRLNSTETNLDRVKDILKNQEEQLDLLKKQSRQAQRYKNIQNIIKRARATLFYKKWRGENDNLKDAEKTYKDQNQLVVDQTQKVTKTNIEYEKIQQTLPELREQESKTTAELQRNSLILENQETEIHRANTSADEINIRIEQINDDLNREQFLLDDADENFKRVKDERVSLEKQQGDLFEGQLESSTTSLANDNPIIDYIDFEDSLEKALASVFGDELMASINKEHYTYWKKLSNFNEEVKFPAGVIPFSKIIKAPENLKKKLDYIGLVENKENIDVLQNNLSDGQILVSKIGEVWRWDGFISKGLQTKSMKAVMEQLQNRRIKQLSTEEKSWKDIMDTAQKRINELRERQESLKADLVKVKKIPEEIRSEKQKLINLIEQKKKNQESILSSLLRTEQKANETNKQLKLEEVRLNELREDKIRKEGIIATLKETLKQINEQVRERLGIAPDELSETANIDPNHSLPSTEDLEKKLDRLIQEQEKLGGVNLLAEQEAKELEDKVNNIKKDHADLTAAIAKLREAINQLNTEGRQRLLAAYGVVNEHFQKLFVKLFGGGKAYLKFTDEKDPLEAGLEVYASPPGKKLQSLSLLSGGEQALTAISLLFAVFLSNPAPICILDEVDAPLDDTNVDRFCTLVDEMSKSSLTKFLVITHHRMTMARVGRLFGVTMPDKGISELVSVDLESAVKFRENE
jgi:chromosome segregation protein